MPNMPCPTHRPGVRINYLKAEYAPLQGQLEQLQKRYAEDQAKAGEYRGQLSRKEAEATTWVFKKYCMDYNTKMRGLDLMRGRMERMETELTNLYNQIKCMIEKMRALKRGIEELERRESSGGKVSTTSVQSSSSASVSASGVQASH